MGSPCFFQESTPSTDQLRWLFQARWRWSHVLFIKAITTNSRKILLMQVKRITYASLSGKSLTEASSKTSQTATSKRAGLVWDVMGCVTATRSWTLALEIASTARRKSANMHLSWIGAGALWLIANLGLNLGCFLSEMCSGNWSSMSCIAQERNSFKSWLPLPIFFFLLLQTLLEGYFSCGVLQCGPGFDKWLIILSAKGEKCYFRN